MLSEQSNFFPYNPSLNTTIKGTGMLPIELLENIENEDGTIVSQVDLYDSISEELSMYKNVITKITSTAHGVNVYAVVERRNNIVTNQSPQGNGKTYTSTREFQQGFVDGRYKRIIIFGPSGAEITWNNMSTKFRIYGYKNLTKSNQSKVRGIADVRGIKMIFMSYGILTGKESEGKKALSHHFITQRGSGYQTTKFFQDIVKQGALIIFDEAHHMRNESPEVTKAMREIYKIVLNTKSQTSIIILSSTLINHDENMLTLMKTLDI